MFISYRRSDTGGRAGRLHDSLADRFGDRNVFHDLSGLAPGAAFDHQIGQRIAACDVVLVLIGSRWLDETGPDGVRRLDRTDDYVRHEIREALAHGKRIVPVLVEDARLPGVAELPDDIAPLVRRQAFGLRDASWRQDVHELARGLEHSPDDPSRRPWRGRIGLALLAVGGAGALVVARIVTGGGDGASSDDLPGCDADDGTWVAVTADESATSTAVDVIVDGEPARFEPRGARYRPEGVGSPIVVEVAVTSTAAPGSGADLYLSEGILDALLVDGVEAEELTCVSVVGDAQIQPGRTAIGELGYRSPVDPIGATIVLATDGGGIVPFGTG